MIRIDLHTHSEASHDGGLKLRDYQSALENNLLDYIAITDHNRIDFATKLREKFGDKIIIGEEIMTLNGEIIGLYLTENIPGKLSLSETIDRIKSQGGLVYIPHPFEKVRSGISESDLEAAVDKIDIIETINGRAVIGAKSNRAQEFAARYNLAAATSSDAHGRAGWGRAHTIISQPPTRTNLVEILKSSTHSYKKPTLRAALYPKYNKIRKILS